MLITRRHNIRILLYSVGFITGLMAVGVAIWWVQINLPPKVAAQPYPAMPSPNGYDYFVAAAKSVKDADKVMYAVDNSRRRALPPPSTPQTSSKTAVQGRPAVTQNLWDHIWTLVEKEALLNKNKQSLKMIREGFTCDYRFPLVPTLLEYPSLDSMKINRIEQLLLLEAQVHAERRNWGESLDSCLDTVDFGTLVGRGASLSTGFRGVFSRARAEKQLWKITEQLTAIQARYAVRRMEKAIAQNVPFGDMLMEEKLCGQRTLAEIFKKPNWRGWFAEQCDTPHTRNSIELAVYLISSRCEDTWGLMTCSKRDTMAEYARTMDQWIARSRHPFAAKLPVPREPKNPYCEMMGNHLINGWFFHYTKAQSRDVLLTAALALHAYRLEHGQYPDKLDELAPSYLRKIPNDPFAVKGPPVYRKKGNSYVLYSIGPDRKDNGGTAIIDPHTRYTENKYEVQHDSQGDSVLGINLP